MSQARTALLAVLVLLAAAPAAKAVRPITPPAPEFPKNAAWINSLPYELARLRGRRVVVVTFLNFYSLNSVRTLPWLKKLWDTYALNGLMIIGVHSPDFAFDRDPAEIREAVERFGIRFPVVVDSGKEIWNAYKNNGWPAHYLLDHRGMIVHDRVGEGAFNEFEHEILLALDNAGYRMPKDHKVPEDPARKECGTATPAFYVGSARGSELKQIKPNRVETIVEARDGEIAVLGKWSKEPQAIRFKGESQRLNTRLRIIYHGAEAAAVLTRTGSRPGRVYVKQDDLWLHAGNANSDVQWDDDDRSYVLVDGPKLFYLTRNRARRMYELTLYPDEAGLGFSGFEFSDDCQTEYDHK